jgi:hypothetical protein
VSEQNQSGHERERCHAPAQQSICTCRTIRDRTNTRRYALAQCDGSQQSSRFHVQRQDNPHLPHFVRRFQTGMQESNRNHWSGWRRRRRAKAATGNQSNINQTRNYSGRQRLSSYDSLS